MKANVDLTENRVFSTREFAPLVKFAGKRRMPWKNLVSNDDYIPDYFPLIPVGDRAAREEYRLCAEELSGDYCDRCGKRIIKFFNDRYPGLCRDCGVDLDKEYGCKMLWMDMPEPRSENVYHRTFYDFLPVQTIIRRWGR